jgi:hypothetical protein
MAATAAEEIVMRNPAENADEQFRYLWNRRAAIQLRALMNRIYYQERQRILKAVRASSRSLRSWAGQLHFRRSAPPRLRFDR